VKRWIYFVLLAIGILGAVYIYLHRQQLGLVRSSSSETAEDEGTSQPAYASRPAQIAWEKVDRSADGFKVEMPSGVKQLDVPAYNEHGGSDQVAMIFSSPDGDTTYSVAWADNPPVARVNGQAPDRTLDMARDDTLMRTQTTLVSENRNTPEGFPGREFLARNSGGGLLNARLIYARPRLYMLIAAFPSAGARKEQDVARFFNSFAVTKPNGMPEKR
jgi:hypothetical protein